MRRVTTQSNVNTIEGDEKKASLRVPTSDLNMPLVKLKKNLQGLNNDYYNVRGQSCGNGPKAKEKSADRQGCYKSKGYSMVK